MVQGRSLPYRESGTYGALAAQVMKLAGVYESDPAEVVAGKLHSSATALLAGTEADPDAVSGHLGVLVGVEAGAEAADREALFYSVREFIEAVAREQPTILVFEDVHWADANLLDLIRALATGVRGLPILFVTLARPELLDLQDDWGSGSTGYTALTLGALDEQHARELTVRRLGSGDQAEEVIRLAEGNPLFIEQLAASIGELRAGQAPHERPRDRRCAPRRAATRGALAAPRCSGRRQGVLARRAPNHVEQRRAAAAARASSNAAT